MNQEMELQTIPAFDLMSSQERADSFHHWVHSFGRSIKYGAALVCAMIAKGESLPLECLPKSMIRMLVAVHERGLCPRLVTHPQGRLAFGLSCSEQESFANDEPVELMVGNGDTLMVQPSKMTGKQLKQVYARDHIRDLGEQRAWLESRRALPSQDAEQVQVRETSKGIEVQVGHARVVLSWRDVARMVAGRMQ